MQQVAQPSPLVLRAPGTLPRCSTQLFDSHYHVSLRKVLNTSMSDSASR